MKKISGVEELDSFILDAIDNNMVVMLYFGATWCGPCKSLKGLLEDENNGMPRLAVAYLDADDDMNDTLMKQYDVEAFPTQVFVKVVENMVKVVGRIEGFQPDELTRYYSKY